MLITKDSFSHCSRYVYSIKWVHCLLSSLNRALEKIQAYYVRRPNLSCLVIFFLLASVLNLNGFISGCVAFFLLLICYVSIAWFIYSIWFFGQQIRRKPIPRSLFSASICTHSKQIFFRWSLTFVSMLIYWVRTACFYMENQNYLLISTAGYVSYTLLPIRWLECLGITYEK